MFDTNRFNPLNTGFAGKMKPQANGGKKNTSSNSVLHSEALVDNWIRKIDNCEISEGISSTTEEQK